MLRILFIAFAWIVAYYRRDLRNWEKYHTTILFTIAASLVVTLITYNHTLWDTSSELGGRLINDFLISILFFPPSLTLYLANFPNHKGVWWSFLYIALWTCIYTFIEGIEYIYGNIHYLNGWNIGWSMLLNILLFMTVRIHFTRPLFAYFLFLIWVIILMFLFDIKVESFK